MSGLPVIFYIEDNRDNRLLIHRILGAEGFEVHSASDAAAGLEFLERQTPDLILMDINLPHVDGYTLTTRLKKLPTLRNTPIIALTANVMKGDREKTIAAGCDGYIHKPINVDLIGDQIREFLVEKPVSSEERTSDAYN